MTSAHPTTHEPEEPHGQTVATPHHHVPYFMIFFTLVALTIVTVLVAFVGFKTELLKVLVALLIAVTKGSLVAMFFMHLKFEGKLLRTILAVPLCLCVLIIVAIIPDVVKTEYGGDSASLHLVNPVPAPTWAPAAD